MTEKPENILEVDNLITSFETDRGMLRAVDHVSFNVPAGKTVGIVGESGCGKSVTAMSIIRLLPQPAGRILGGQIRFHGRDLVRASDAEIHKVRGGEIGVIFQEPMAALNPVHRIGRQVSEVFRIHKNLSKKDAWDAATEMLKLVKIPAPEQRMMDYPHHLSGGMRQRIVIAMALACRPSLLIADEPTTALDVTVQAQILDLMARLQAEMGMSAILITHDLGVIAESCDQVVVMYAGRVVEQASAGELFANPLHAYTKGLLSSIPTLDMPSKSRLNTIPGMVASLADLSHGCRFCQRMGRTAPVSRERPRFAEVSPGHWVETCPECTSNIEH
ncbi:ABC transporter ATP-binding protein [Luteolibacter yonseiensis]|uniref:ABC transporter ATP-binding protein n=1 Tax=Luteolibacter yonseiensis TaxID=1144680 RepID=A0A934R502_9BACT|nr:ABC transporter ATP-binding protein [Luteolibacter yonseiensis]MBK1816118.1 ABC transporter ATP-binding protein [Luteolibacter yonseiensis]